MAANDYYNPTQPDDNDNDEYRNEDQNRTRGANGNDNYRAEVQNRVEDLVSGNRPRNPRLSSFGTRRLILEAVVEELRIYRIRRQGEVMEMAAKERREERRRVRSREGHRHRHHRDRDEDGGHRHRRRHRHHDDEEGGRRRHRSRSGHRDEGRHERHERSRSRPRNRDRELPDPVIEGQPDSNPEFMMTGGAGPAGTLHEAFTPRERSLSPSHHLRRQSGISNLRQAPDGSPFTTPPPRPQTPHPHGRSRSRHRRIRTKGKPPAAIAGLYQSAQRQVGPDGITPFGSVPVKAAGVGFVAHVMNTYKHIKAEHETGHRERSVLEKTVDGWRGKGGNASLPKEEKHAKRNHGKDHERPKGMYGRVPENERRDVGNGRGKVWTGGEMELPFRSGPPHIPFKDGVSRTSSLDVEFTAPPAAPHDDVESALPPNPVVLQPPPSPLAESVNSSLLNVAQTSPYLPPQRAVSANPSLVEVAQAGFIPPPPPPPPMSSASPHQPPNPSHPPTPAQVPSPNHHSSLLSQIRKAPALRKVPASQVKDKSTSSGVGNVYEATEHSREVEEREREEEEGGSGDGGAGWSFGRESPWDGEEEVERRRKLRRELGGER